LLHLSYNGFEALTIGNPLAVKCGLFWEQPPGDGFACFLPRELKVRAVPAGRAAGASAIGLAATHPSLHQTSLADKAHGTKTRFEARIFGPAPTELLVSPLVGCFAHCHTSIYQ